MANDEPNFQIFSTLRYDPELSKTTVASDSYPEPRGSPYYLLRYHYDRILCAAADFKWEAAITKMRKDMAGDMAIFAETLDRYIPDVTRPWRLRILLYHNGHFSVEAAPTTPYPSHIFLLPRDITFNTLGINTRPADDEPARPKVWELRLDTQPTTPSPSTRHKTTLRDMYNKARQRANILSLQETNEVLLHNPKGEVMEGSITTVYFKARRGKEVDSLAAEWITPPLSSGGNAGTTRRYALDAGFCTEDVVRISDLVDGENVWLSNGGRGFMPAILKL